MFGFGIGLLFWSLVIGAGLFNFDFLLSLFLVLKALALCDSFLGEGGGRGLNQCVNPSRYRAAHRAPPEGGNFLVIGLLVISIAIWLWSYLVIVLLSYLVISIAMCVLRIAIWLFVELLVIAKKHFTALYLLLATKSKKHRTTQYALLNTRY